jgi:hypothetical protein
MNVPLTAQLGTSSPPVFIGTLVLNVSSIQSTASWAGSYHVLDMGRHYQDYVLGPSLPPFPQLATIPAHYPYDRLTTKIRATGVTGNIGEGVAALFARRVLGARLEDIAHVKARVGSQKRKVPDYLMRIGHLLGPMSGLNAVAQLSGGPAWWPIESKARKTDASAAAARREAVEQLISCWSLLLNSEPGAVGYGAVVTFAYEPPREVRVSFLVPKNIPQLHASVAQAVPLLENVLDNLYGC